MRVRTLHPWDIDVQEAIRLQRTLSHIVTLRGRISAFHLVAGCDVAYDHFQGLVFGGVVIWDLRDQDVREAVVVQRALTFPYIPSLLSFREAPVVLEALAQLKEEPEVILVDGQGIAHPRGIGLATHLGLHVRVPTVGCAKSRLVGDHDTPGLQRGDYVWLISDGRQIGAVVRSRAGVRPVYVSPGNKISVEGALRVFLACLGQFRLPEPLRQAHLLVERRKRRASH